jgi:ribonucleoside-diphosphate reductase alpha chain
MLTLLFMLTLARASPANKFWIEPAGPVSGHPNIKNCTSFIDPIFRVLALHYLGDTSYCQIEPAPISIDGVSNSLKETEALEIMARAAVATMRKSKLDSTPPPLEFSQGDAPFCDVCGHLTVRSGTCYRCPNCGNSMGCS